MKVRPAARRDPTHTPNADKIREVIVHCPSSYRAGPSHRALQCKSTFGGSLGFGLIGRVERCAMPRPKCGGTGQRPLERLDRRRRSACSVIWLNAYVPMMPAVKAPITPSDPKSFMFSSFRWLVSRATYSIAAPPVNSGCRA